jgi:hypothetical protein
VAETSVKGTPLQRGERLQIMLEKDELIVLDDFRFANRLPSRAAAVRELLRRGLSAEGFAIEEPDGRSSSFGVLDRPSNDDDAEGAA